MEIVVRFINNKMQPEMFWLNGREYRVKDIALVWERSDGGRKYLCFAVDTGGMLAELDLDKQDLSWSVAKCEPSCT